MSDADEISKIVSDIGLKFQALEDLLKNSTKQDTTKLFIRFPRGFIRPVSYYKEKYSFVKQRPLLDNISYCLQMTDIFRWIMNRFDIDLSAKEMIIKHGIICTSSAIEAMIWYLVSAECNLKPAKRFSKNIAKMQGKKVLSDKLLEEIDSFRKMRDHVHLNKLNHKENRKYAFKDYNMGILILHKIKNEIESPF